jgi:hypothetical protein
VTRPTGLDQFAPKTLQQCNDDVRLMLPFVTRGLSASQDYLPRAAACLGQAAPNNNLPKPNHPLQEQETLVFGRCLIARRNVVEQGAVVSPNVRERTGRKVMNDAWARRRWTDG